MDRATEAIVGARFALGSLSEDECDRLTRLLTRPARPRATSDWSCLLAPGRALRASVFLPRSNGPMST